MTKRKTKRLPQLPVIEFEDFKLRPFMPGDEDSLQKHLNDPRVARDVSNIPYPYSIKNAEDWIEFTDETFGPDSKRVDFAIDNDGEVIGSVAFINIDGHKAQLSVWVNPNYWRTGIAYRALAGLIDFGFVEMHLVRIWAFHYPENEKTGGLLLKLGLKHEGTHPMEWKKVIGGIVYYFDSEMYGILRKDWLE